MKKIEFNAIQVRNFLSYGNTPVKLSFDSGITFITGFNKDDNSRNGVGKTSLIVESLSFVLFGKTYRKVTQDEIKNRVDGTNCSVTVWYTVNDEQYEVTRSISPNTLTRTKVGFPPETKTIPETTKDILNDLGITKEVFENTLVMTAKNSKSFFSQDKSLKTKFIEGILGLECFSELFKDAKDEYNTLNTSIGKSEAALSTLNKSYLEDMEYESHWYDSQTLKIDAFKAEQTKLTQIQPVDRTADISALEKNIIDAKQGMSDSDIKIKKLSAKDGEVRAGLRIANEQLKKLHDKPTTCPTCNRAFEEHTAADFENEISELTAKIATYNEQKGKISNALQILTTQSRDFTDKIHVWEHKIKELVAEQSEFIKSQDKIAAILSKIDDLVGENNPFVEKNKNSSAKLAVLRENLEADKRKLKILDGVRIVFSPTGVKTAVIKKIMDVFNERFGFYLEKLHTPCRIVFDEFFDENVTSLTGDAISYDSMSEGEKGRVNFSLLFAFRDIRRLQSSVTINLSVFDELFDSSIDGNASEQILELLSEMSVEHDDCYYIITHNTGNVSLEGAKLIELEKENGITRIV